MPSIDSLVTAIRAAVEQIREVGTSLTSSRMTVEELKEQFALLGAGDKADQLEQIEQGITEQPAVVAVAAAQAEAAQAGAEALRGTGGSGGGGAPPGPPSTLSAEPSRRDPSTVGPREGMAGIRSYDEAGTAEGNPFFASGRQNDRPLKATPGETKFRPGDVKPEWRHTKPAQGHIAGNVVADMLHTDETKAVLFLNAEPCDRGGAAVKPTPPTTSSPVAS